MTLQQSVCVSVCVSVYVCGKANGYTTNSLSDSWPAESMLIAVPRKVHGGCNGCRPVMGDVIHFIVLLCLPFL